jgi:hypothetical protein
MFTNKTNRIVNNQRLIAGIKKHLKGSSVILGAKKVPLDLIVQLLQSRIDAIAATTAAKAAWERCVSEERARDAESGVLVERLQKWLLLTFADAPESLADFGLVQKQRRRVSVATKAAAVKKAQATRAANEPPAAQASNGIAAASNGIATVTNGAAARSP